MKRRTWEPVSIDPIAKEFNHAYEEWDESDQGPADQVAGLTEELLSPSHTGLTLIRQADSFALDRLFLSSCPRFSLRTRLRREVLHHYVRVHARAGREESSIRLLAVLALKVQIARERLSRSPRIGQVGVDIHSAYECDTSSDVRPTILPRWCANPGLDWVEDSS